MRARPSHPSEKTLAPVPIDHADVHRGEETLRSGVRCRNRGADSAVNLGQLQGGAFDASG